MGLCYYSVGSYRFTIRLPLFHAFLSFCHAFLPFNNTFSAFDRVVIDSLESRLSVIAGEWGAVRHIGAGDVCVPQSGLIWDELDGRPEGTGDGNSTIAG